MAVRTKEEIFSLIKDRVGEDNSDETLSFIEDITDTFNDMETRMNSDNDWETKYNNLDSEWREKYKARFFGNVDDDDVDVYNNNEPPKKLTYEDLFEESEEK